MWDSLFFFWSVWRTSLVSLSPQSAHCSVAVGTHFTHVPRKGKIPMHTISAIAAAFASPTTDNSSTSAIAVIAVVLVGFLILMGVVSSGNSAKRLVRKYYCPHCHKQVRYTSLKKKPPFTQAKPRNNQRPTRRSRPLTPRINAPVVRRNGGMYCPYCHKPILI